MQIIVGDYPSKCKCPYGRRCNCFCICGKRLPHCQDPMTCPMSHPLVLEHYFYQKRIRALDDYYADIQFYNMDETSREMKTKMEQIDFMYARILKDVEYLRTRQSFARRAKKKTKKELEDETKHLKLQVAKRIEQNIIAQQQQEEEKAPRAATNQELTVPASKKICHHLYIVRGGALKKTRRRIPNNCLQKKHRRHSKQTCGVRKKKFYAKKKKHANNSMTRSNDA